MTNLKKINNQQKHGIRRICNKKQNKILNNASHVRFGLYA